MKSVAELCRPRPNVFVDTARDDVLNLSDLIEGNIDPDAFFEENFRTKGMNILFQTVFNRFMGKSETGVIRLTQAMGGGKTHNMLALALLAQNPSQDVRVMRSSASGGALLSSCRKRTLLHPTTRLFGHRENRHGLISCREKKH